MDECDPRLIAPDAWKLTDCELATAAPRLCGAPLVSSGRAWTALHQAKGSAEAIPRRGPVRHCTEFPAILWALARETGDECSCDADACRSLSRKVDFQRTERGHSSAGRALAWHARGRRFDPAWLHQIPVASAACRELSGPPLASPPGSSLRGVRKHRGRGGPEIISRLFEKRPNIRRVVTGRLEEKVDGDCGRAE